MVKLQVAGGLAIYRLKHSNFRKLLVPKAKTLLLTGDCLTIGKSYENISNEFMRYVTMNWKEVIYIPGRSELRSPGSAVPCIWRSKINFTYRTHYSLSSIYTIIGATYVTSGDTSWLPNEEKWVEETLASEVRQVILASYCPLPINIVTKPITAIVQGTGKNQFDPTKPVVNRYSDYNGDLRSDYNPECVLEIRGPPRLRDLDLERVEEACAQVRLI